MFNSEDKAKEIIEFLRNHTTEEMLEQTYGIKEWELLNICEEFIAYINDFETVSSENQSLKNYIRLLEKENKELQSNDN